MIFKSCPNHGNEKDNRCDEQCHVDGHVVREISVSKHKLKVDSVWFREVARPERCKMSYRTMGHNIVTARFNLET